MNNISKKFEFKLLTEDTSLYKTGVKLFVADDVEFTIEVLQEYNPITEEKVAMDLTGCTIDCLASRMNSNTSVQQRYGADEDTKGVITILDELNGIVKFKPNKAIMQNSDKLQIQFTIKDSDENISIQPFLFIVLDTVESENIEIPTDDIKTLNELEEKIQENKDFLDGIKEEVIALNQDINNANLDLLETQENIDKYLRESTELIDSKIEVLNGKVDSLEQELNTLTESLVRQSILSPFVREGESYVSFKLIVAGYEAKKLASNSFLVNVSYQTTSPKKQGLSYTGLLTSIFYEDSKAVPYAYMNLTTMYKPSIAGMEIEPSVVFNGSVNKLIATESYYEIWIKTRIPKSEVNNAKCVISTFGTKIGVI